MSTYNYWFKLTRNKTGWYPARWQGWASIALVFVGPIVPIWLSLNMLTTFKTVEIVATVLAWLLIFGYLFVWIVLHTGERPNWFPVEHKEVRKEQWWDKPN